MSKNLSKNVINSKRINPKPLTNKANLVMIPEIRTYTKRRFNFLDIQPSSIDITDIAHALSMMCRFNGHAKFHYSIAQHSVLTSYLVPDEFAFHALMHDAAEAYIGDITTPLKQLLPDFQKIESYVEKTIFNFFELPDEVPPEVKTADKIMLLTEQRDVVPEFDEFEDQIQYPPLTPADIKIKEWSPQVAKEKFLARFLQLNLT